MPPEYQSSDFENKNFGRLKIPETPYLFAAEAPLWEESFLENDSHGIQQSYQRHGFVKIRNFFSKQKVVEIRARLREYQDNLPEQVSPYDATYLEHLKAYSLLGRIDVYEPYFNQLLNDPKFEKIAELLLGGEVVNRHIQFFNLIPSHSPPTPPHQDGFNFLVNDGSSLDMWLPLLDVDGTNGCLHYVKGSHLLGRRPHGRDAKFGPPYIQSYADKDRENEVAVQANMGDLVIHHNLTLHGSEPNQTSLERWAITFPYFLKRDLFELTENEWLEGKIAGFRTEQEVRAIRAKLMKEKTGRP